MRREGQNRNFFCYIVKGQYFWIAKKALAGSPPFSPPPLPLCPLSFLLFLLVYSFRERPQCHYLKRSLCVTSSNPFVLTQTVGRGALSRSGLPSLHSSCTFSQRCNDPHYSLLPLKCYSERTALHLLHAARHEPCQTDTHWRERRFHHPRFPVILVRDTLLLCLSVAMHVSVIFFLLLLFKILQTLVAASLLDCYINLKHFLHPSRSQSLRIIFLSDTTSCHTRTRTHTHAHTSTHAICL